MKELLGKYTPDQNLADLHMHTNRSDGHLDPWQIIDLAEKFGQLHTVAITDHNKIEPAVEAKEYGIKNGYSIEVIVGSEISTSEGHILGLYLEYNIPNRRTVEWTIKEIHKQGGLAIAPHPLYKRVISLTQDKLMEIMNNPDPEVSIDGFEVFNAGVNDNPKTTAIKEAQEFYGKYKDKLGAAIGSTDGHYFTVGRGLTGYTGDLRNTITQRSTSVLMLEQGEIENLIKIATKLFPEEVDRLRPALQKYAQRRKKS